MDGDYFKNNEVFTAEFLDNHKKNHNTVFNISRVTKEKVKQIAHKQGIFFQVLKLNGENTSEQKNSTTKSNNFYDSEDKP